MAREMYLVGVSEDELRPDPKPEGPKNFKGKLDNFWYHYKWPVIISAFVLIALAIIFSSLFTKDDPDYTLVLVTKNPINNSSQLTSDTAADKLASELQKYGRDVDGDGKVEVQVEYINLGDSSQYGVFNKQKLMAHFSTSDVMFYAFDSSSYQDNVAALESSSDEKFFSKLSFQADGICKDGYCWNWKNDESRNDPDLSGIPEDLYFGVRNNSGTASNKTSTKIHDECMELLQAYVTKAPLTNSDA